jgi:hypothetical protein
MIQKFVDCFMSKQAEMEAELIAVPPDSYQDLVKKLISNLVDETAYSMNPDKDRIHVVDDGDYQGTKVFIIAATGYQPSTYWAIKVNYGSCSSCDTFEGIRLYDATCTPAQARDYWTLMLHMVQEMKEI